jgi:hypothetical protein
VLLLSSKHNDMSIDPDHGATRKPSAITFYNETKGGVDSVDQMCATYSVSRNSRRWTLTVFFHVMNVAGINAIVANSCITEDRIVRRELIKELAFSLIREQLVRRSEISQLPRALTISIKRQAGLDPDDEPGPPRAAKKARCGVCTVRNDNKYTVKCCKCDVITCPAHRIVICRNCVDDQGDEDHNTDVDN